MTVPTFTLVNGRKLPLVGLGTFTVADEKDLETSLNTALELGYRHIDTATIYRNEALIGKILKKWFDSGKLNREDVFITTKLPSWGVHPDKVEEILDQSLKDLQLDYVDLYLIHFPIYVRSFVYIESDPTANEPQPTDLIGVWRKLEEQVEKGKAKAIGVSNFSKEQVSRIFANARIKPAANQVELHAYLQQPELLKYLRQHGIAPISYFSLLNSGLNDFFRKIGQDGLVDKPPPNLLEDRVVKKISAKHGKSAAQVLLKFLVQKNIAVIPKSVTPKRLKENLDLFNFTLDAADIKALEGLDRGEKGRRATNDYSPAFVNHPEYPYPRVPRKK